MPLEVLLMYGLVSRALHVRQLLLHFLISGGAFGGLGRIKDWVQLFCARCLNYPWGGRYRTVNRKAVVSM